MGLVRYGQKGYVGLKMSVRAAKAYRKGQKPKTKWSKRLMLEEFARCCKNLSLPYDTSIQTMKKDDLFNTFFVKKSWHHTGKYAQKTDFYGISRAAVRKHIASCQAAKLF